MRLSNTFASLATLGSAIGTSTARIINPSGNVVVGYWHNWCDGLGYKLGVAPCMRLRDIDVRYNVVMVSFMKVYDTSVGRIPTFELAAEVGMSEDEFKNEIAELNSQGRAVVLALGGADAHIAFQPGDTESFAQEIIRLVEEYGFDGLDIDLEQTAIHADANEIVVPHALRMVKDHYRAQGQNFLVTMAAEFPYLKTNRPDGGYMNYLETLEGYYDWINPQFYNQGGDGVNIDGPPWWLKQNDDEKKEEFIYAISDNILRGTDNFYKIADSCKLVFGIPSSDDAAATGFVKDPRDLKNAFNRLASEGRPLRGVMTWSINWDVGHDKSGKPYNSQFINDYGDYILREYAPGKCGNGGGPSPPIPTPEPTSRPTPAPTTKPTTQPTAKPGAKCKAKPGMEAWAAYCAHPDCDTIYAAFCELTGSPDTPEVSPPTPPTTKPTPAPTTKPTTRPSPTTKPTTTPAPTTKPTPTQTPTPSVPSPDETRFPLTICGRDSVENLSDEIKELRKQTCQLDLAVVEAIRARDPNNPQNVKNVEAIVDESKWLEFFPHSMRHEAYSYENFLKAVGLYPVVCKDEATCAKTLATIFAHYNQETGAHSHNDYTDGLYFLEENQGNAGSYVQESYWKPTPGKKYYGRGPKQISYNFNYAPFSRSIFGDEQILLDNPERVTQGWLSFASSMWFFITPQYPKPSMISVVNGDFVPNAAQEAVGIKSGFGLTTNIINGGIECGQGAEKPQSANRMRYYQWFADQLGVDYSSELLGCKDMKTFDSSSDNSNVKHTYWVLKWDGSCGEASWQTKYSQLYEGDFARCQEEKIPM